MLSTTLRRFVLCAAVLITAGFVSHAGAATVQVRDSATSSGYYVSGTSASSLRATINGSTYNTYSTGVFNLEADYGTGWQSLLTFCLEPNQAIGFGTNPTDTTGRTFTVGLDDNYPAFTPSEVTLLETLWYNALGLAQTSTRNAAAFQAIVWEIARDNVFNLDGGNFDIQRSYNSFSQDVFNIANGWVTNINNGTWTGSTQLYTLTSSKSQDFLTPVPEPASLGLLALGGLMLLGRRRRHTA